MIVGGSALFGAQGPVQIPDARVIFSSGANGTTTTDYIQLDTFGNATSFGTIDSSRQVAACSSATRGLSAGGLNAGLTRINVINYCTIATTSSWADFGDLVTSKSQLAGLSNSTRGLFCVGNTGSMSATTEYVTIASTGNGTNFGNSTQARRTYAGLASTTRGITAGGDNNAGTHYDNIEYCTISTPAAWTDFGNLHTGVLSPAGASNGTYGYIAGGFDSAYLTKIQRITIASTGNAADWGNLTVARGYMNGTSNPSVAVFGGGTNLSGNIDTIDYVWFSGNGAALDFGNLSVARGEVCAFSDSHGGL